MTVPTHFLKDFTIEEASMVDDGDNPHAKVAFFKRRGESGDRGDAAIRKDRPGAMDFDEALAAAEVRQRLDKFWPLWSALQDSMVSIVQDPAVSNKGAALKASVEQFSDTITDVLGDLEMMSDGEDEDLAKSANLASSMIEDHMATLEELTKRVETAEGEVKKQKDRADAAEAEVKVQKGRADAAEGQVVELKKAAPAADEDPDEAFIKHLPEAAQAGARESFRKLNARALASEAQLRKSREEAEDQVEIAKAKALDLPGDMTVVGEAIRIVRKAKPELADKVSAVLKGAGEAIKAGKLLKSAGTSDGAGAGAAELDEADPEREVLTKAKELQTTDPKLTDEQAYSKAIGTGDLYERVQKFNKARK